MANNSKKLDEDSVKSIIQKLKFQHSLAYAKAAPYEIEALSNHRNWLKNPVKENLKAIHSLKRKLAHIKTPLNQSVIQKAILELEEANQTIANIYKNFCNKIELNKKYLRTLLNEQKTEDQKLLLPTNHVLALLSKAYGGPASLKKAFESNPALVPVGIKVDISCDAIRRRIRNYTNP